MVGNGILAFAVIFVVILFVYISMQLSQDKQAKRHYAETYTIELSKGFVGDSLSLFVNDSLIINQQVTREPIRMEVGRFADQSALMIVDNLTEKMSTFDLSEKGGTYTFVKGAVGDIVLKGR